MPTPARRAISSKLTFSPACAKAALAASISNCRFRAPSARGLRAGGMGFLFAVIGLLLKSRLQNGGILRILNGGSLHFQLNHFDWYSGRAVSMAGPRLAARVEPNAHRQNT